MKGISKIIITCIIVLIVILIPLPADDLYLRFHVREGSTEGYRVYYATLTDPVFSDEQSIDSAYDEETGAIAFRMDSSLEGCITGIRLDCPPRDDTIVIDGISINSGGVIRRRISVPDLFDPSDYIMVNGAVIDTIAARENVYIATTPDDPYVVFGPEGVDMISSGFSHKMSTKLCIALLIAAASALYSKNLFGKPSTEE